MTFYGCDNLNNIVVDKNNDGIISDGSEVSIFLKKSENIVKNGLCTDSEYNEILEYCPREITTRGGKITIGTKELIPNESKQKQHLEEFNAEIDRELKSRNLDKTSENVGKVL